MDVCTLEDLVAIRPVVRDVPIDGNLYHVRRFTFADRLAITSDAQAREGEQDEESANREFALQLVAKSLCDAAGKLLGVTVDMLRNFDAAVIDVLADQALQLNGMRAGAADTAKKSSWPIRICSLPFGFLSGLVGRWKKS